MIQRKYLILLSLGGLIIILDQITKLYVHTHFHLGESVPVIQSYFDLTYVRNVGAAFGFLSQSHETFRNIFFLSMPPLAALFILYILKSLPEEDLVQIIALSSVFGGAIGNYIDRLRFGYVIDFLDFHYQKFYSWPAFNVADIAIVCGISVIALIMFRDWRQEVRMKKAQSSN